MKKNKNLQTTSANNLREAPPEYKRKQIEEKSSWTPFFKGPFNKQFPINSKGQPPKNLREAPPGYPEIANS